MSDLISRSALIDFLNNVPFMIEHQNFKDIAVEWVKDQPAAYDVDKVVGAIGKLIIPDKCGANTPEEMAYSEGIVDAIAIVKGGGVDG